jgi:hypothetical protein
LETPHKILYIPTNRINLHLYCMHEACVLFDIQLPMPSILWLFGRKLRIKSLKSWIKLVQLAEWKFYRVLCNWTQDSDVVHNWRM